MRQVLLITLTSVVGNLVVAQEEPRPSPFSVNGYMEVYYAYDFNKPENNTRPGFVYAFNRHNEVNLNIGFIRGSYNTDKARASLALMAGTYPNANLAAEPGVLKNVYEAYAGVKISSTRNLWVDAGIFGSHIGFESAVGKDCWNLTRSISADNSPYYEAGAKISYTTDNSKWFFSGLVLNGWQRIQRVDGNSLPSFGTQISFKPSSSITLNSSSFIGTDKPDSARLMRYFHNFYGIFQVSEKIGITVGFDCGWEDQDVNRNAMNNWYTPVVIVRAALSDKLSLSARGEYYADEHGVIIATGTPNGFRTGGFSLNLDYQVFPAALWRIEARNFISQDAIFMRNDKQVDDDTFVCTSLAISF
jgi:Putative beta-barrel porin-2, OmpL-like. bbp2